MRSSGFLVAYRLIAPGSEWKLHRKGFSNSAMAEFVGRRFWPS